MNILHLTLLELSWCCDNTILMIINTLLYQMMPTKQTKPNKIQCNFRPPFPLNMHSYTQEFHLLEFYCRDQIESFWWRFQRLYREVPEIIWWWWWCKPIFVSNPTEAKVGLVELKLKLSWGRDNMTLYYLIHET